MRPSISWSFAPILEADYLPLMVVFVKASMMHDDDDDDDDYDVSCKMQVRSGSSGNEER